MINPNQYSHRVSILFNEHVQGQLELEEFIQKLREMETKHKQILKDNSSESGFWFKFSDDDTLATSIDDLERDLTNSNREFTLERMKEVINTDQELVVHYS
ncbi:hypothetical protein [Salinimicrobium sediminilitoris]|uniref:hypothetical protein n=1 Tax=Salinimicrobium sediminilitoris TaxID=2876715 RepID=UPI001E3F643E|nr:hypothetical protein [Salinimicrobium sediminilitoris]MCC8360280.1 hypothetical protein [Salinimicrobium sediminilitoris]